MSRSLLGAEEEYLHSPVDDLESFFWVALWSVMFNNESGQWSSREEVVQRALLDIDKDKAIRCFLVLPPDTCNHPARCFRDVMTDWWFKVQNRQVNWVRDVLEKIPEDTDKESYFLPHFHRFALQGVLDVLGVLHKHWEGEISWKSWTGPI